ncbi:MAG: hypothetical protein J7L38_06315, partial [Thermoproteales archaeon]|nr:hypothetical protein [Thermoproteales archaeon]
LVYRGNQIILRPLEPINTSDPLFRNFFVMNVLEKFKQEDMERAASGEILEEEGFKYRVKQSSKGMLEEIVIMNVRDDKRIRELKGAFRWMMETYLLRRKTQS